MSETNVPPLCQALKESQLQNQHFKQAYQQLYVKYRGVLANLPKQGGKRTVENIKMKEDQEATQLGKRYAIMVEPWVDLDVFAP